MKITFVIPKYGVPISDPCAFPLGPLYVSAVLRMNGHEVKFLNFNLQDFDLREELQGRDRALFTGFEDTLPFILEGAGICREMGVKTILGGALATFLPDRMLEFFDTVVLGEGEEVIELALTSPGKIQGHMPDLRVLPFPDYEGFGVEKYHRRNGFRHICVLTSRGCPNDCAFCAHVCAFQVRPLKDVFEEIDHYRGRYNVDAVVVADNTANLSKKRWLSLCAGMKSRIAGQGRAGWSAAIRVDPWDEEMTAAATESGCFYLLPGVESFRQDRLDRMKKGITVKQIHECLDLLEKYKIRYHGNILFGLDGESEEDILRELEDGPRGYRLFPAFVRPFIGTRCGRRPAYSQDFYLRMNGGFRSVIEAAGMTLYPELKTEIRAEWSAGTGY